MLKVEIKKNDKKIEIKSMETKLEKWEYKLKFCIESKN